MGFVNFYRRTKNRFQKTLLRNLENVVENSKIGANYFRIFGFPAKYEIDKSRLKSSYYLLSRKYHPDNRDTGNISIFLHLQEAYKTLKDDRKRANYIYGLKFDEQIQKMGKKDMETIMDLNEEVSRAVTALEKKEISKKLDELIDECKKNNKVHSFLIKWGYLENLKNRL